MFDLYKKDDKRIFWNDNNSLSGCEGWYEDSDKYRLICIFGTNWDNDANLFKGLDDVYADLDFRAIKLEGKYTCHRGFYTYAQKCFSFLQKENIFNTEKKIILVGHSLGAAMVAHISLFLNGLNTQVFPILYGCPTSWGTKNLSKKFKMLFPDTRNFVVGVDFTQWWNLHPLSLLRRYTAPCKSVHIKKKFINIHSFLLDHDPEVVKEYYPDPISIYEA